MASTRKTRSKSKTRSKAGAKKKGSRSRRAKKGGPSRGLVVIAVILAIVAVAGITSVKFFQTPRGQATLLDAGYDDYYALVQENLDTAMRVALEDFGMRRHIQARNRITLMRGKKVRFLEWVVPCDESVDFILINLALSKAAKAAGGRVRRTQEQNEGRSLVVHAGTHFYDTHRITIAKPSPRGGRPAGAGDRDARGTPSAGSVGADNARPRVAIVIDDFGYWKGGVASEMLELDLPLTVSVLPTLPYSTAMLARARETGHCTLLHLPMEAGEGNGYDIEPVRTTMSGDEIRGMVEDYLDQLDGVDGVNNHQGSLATTDVRVMEEVLGVLRRRRLFFLDSLTSANSVAYNTARELGVPAARNRVFLDDDTEDPEVVSERLRRLVELANKHGSAIGIGHPHRWTLQALLESESFLESAGVDLVPVCALVQ